ncbi:dTDP-4-dehydrorhamnose 3,5-epimerase family protein [Streptomyces sp. ISL-111]|nr:dTDP-4-dehydrorhamnose 3,5-epimerase family protein [Streptomyces sp. ISL-111]MBT2424615.1 dTDP-4-dehydrorhamnose 3,5-epimerase family protein [Streptomyces sp. ISL-112]MBT2465150.1 dTDP-4-dehydrorhamnose 3,5-epimerase family protein [Streptomyces sp. ISL-63]
MQWKTMGVHGARVFTPTVFPDERGLFVAPFQRDPYTEAVGLPPFPPVQTAHSRSRRGVVRGVHYTAAPPGMATYVYCAQGRVLDMVVDVRVGSPTFGQWDSVLLDAQEFRAVYLPLGVGHAFSALEDDTVMSYLLSGGYSPEDEKAVSVFDPVLKLPVTQSPPPVLSPRDRSAPTLAQAQESGLLPDYATCLELEAKLCSAVPGLPSGVAR